jgi:protein-tyrosine phosphatase
MKKPVRVLFVCTGNICRSPTAEAIFRKTVADAGADASFEIASAGTHGYHVGHGADTRSAHHARARGIDLSAHRVRSVHADDFSEWDHVVAMDLENIAALSRVCPREHAAKVTLFLEHCPSLGVREVPDPYYGGDQGFERVLDLCEAAAAALFEKLRPK